MFVVDTGVVSVVSDVAVLGSPVATDLGPNTSCVSTDGDVSVETGVGEVGVVVMETNCVDAVEGVWVPVVTDAV